MEMMKKQPSVTIKEIAEKIGVSDRTIKKQISKLKEEEMIKRIGPDKGGYWEILADFPSSNI